MLRRNFYVRGGEIDIIAEKGELLVFVEVRAWDHRYWEGSSPAVTIRKSKMKRIVRAARYFMHANGINEYRRYVRFDVAAVIKTAGGFSMEYYESAFQPEEQ